MTIANESSSYGISLSAEVGLICRASIDATTVDTTQRTIRVVISELCNGGQGYTLSLLHDGIGVESMTYDDKIVADALSTPTELTTRAGAWRGTRVLVVNISGNSQPTIHGLSIQQSSNRL